MMAGMGCPERASGVGAAAFGVILLALSVSMAEVGHAGQPLRLAQGAPKASGAPSAPRPPVNVFVFFDYGKSTLVQSALPLVDMIVEQFKSTGAKEARIVAHTDSAEPNSEALSLARASTLRTALIAKGVPAQAIAIVGAGSASPLVPTAKGTKEPQNRRAQVTLLP